MTPENKKRLQDAFQAALRRHPEPDAPIPGMTKHDGSPLSFRDLVTSALASEQVYQAVDDAVAQGAKFDDILSQLVHGEKPQGPKI